MSGLPDPRKVQLSCLSPPKWKGKTQGFPLAGPSIVTQAAREGSYESTTLICLLNRKIWNTVEALISFKDFPTEKHSILV